MTHQKIKSLRLILVLAVVVSLASCAGGHANADKSDNCDALTMQDARLLEIREHQDFTEVRITNPWDTTQLLDTYILVDRDKPLPSSAPEGTIIRVPLNKALVYSSVHAGLLSELGSLHTIGGVCNASYIRDSQLKHRISEGKVADCGPDLSPDIEKIIMLGPDAILLSPFESNTQYGKIKGLGIPAVQCADYMEPTPLGRAEWIRFFGRLTGKAALADSLYKVTRQRYIKLKERVAKTADRPSILLDRQYGATWDVPTSHSTMGILIEDAGGRNPFDSEKKTGSTTLDPEQVLTKAHDADVWLVRYYQDNEKTLSELRNDNPINGQFTPLRKGKVYGCNTKTVDYFEQTPFHPDMLLEDLINIIHPETTSGSENLHFFKKMEP